MKIKLNIPKKLRMNKEYKLEIEGINYENLQDNVNNALEHVHIEEDYWYQFIFSYRKGDLFPGHFMKIYMRKFPKGQGRNKR